MFTQSNHIPSQALAPLSSNFVRMMRDDFVRLLRSDDRTRYPVAVDRRLALDLAELNGLASAW